MPTNPQRPSLATISTPQQIAMHPTNTSKSKQLYSFPKASRFSKKALRSNCNVAYYDVNCKLLNDQRAFSMGASRRLDFASLNKNSPGPCVYFPKNKTISAEKKGFGFGKPVDKKKKKGTKVPVPGPGAYDVLKKVPKGIEVGFRIKTKVLKDENVNVGPGLYKIPNTLNPVGKGLMSRFKSSPGFRIVPTGLNKGRVKRIDNTPHYYDDKCEINGLGKYPVSRMKNNAAWSFGKSERKFFDMKKSTPGPGYYGMVSDFGIYQSSKVKK